MCVFYGCNWLAQLANQCESFSARPLGALHRCTASALGLCYFAHHLGPNEMLASILLRLPRLFSLFAFIFTTRTPSADGVGVCLFHFAHLRMARQRPRRHLNCVYLLPMAIIERVPSLPLALYVSIISLLFSRSLSLSLTQLPFTGWPLSAYLASRCLSSSLLTCRLICLIYVLCRNEVLL